MKNYPKIILLVLIVLSLVYINCQKDNPLSVSSLNKDANIGFKINFIESSKNFLEGQSSKQNVNYVEVTISGEGLSSPKTVQLDISGDEAKGKVNLPFGSKTFDVIASVTSGSIEIPLFWGSTSTNVSESNNNITIDLMEIISYEDKLFWHDGVFESNVYTQNKGDIFAAYFDIAALVGEPVFVKGISYYLVGAGHSSGYRTNIQDQNHTVRFRTSSALSVSSDGQKDWNLIWNNPSQGIFTGGVYAGLEYDSDSGWPEIGYDKSFPTGNSKWYKSSENLWYYMTDGDFAITITVQTQSGKLLKLSPTKIVNSYEKETSSTTINRAK